MKKKQSSLFEIICYVAAFSPLFLKPRLGSSYVIGFLAGGLCSWGFCNIFNTIPLNLNNKESPVRAEKKQKIKVLIILLRKVKK